MALYCIIRDKIFDSTLVVLYTGNYTVHNVFSLERYIASSVSRTKSKTLGGGVEAKMAESAMDEVATC